MNARKADTFFEMRLAPSGELQPQEPVDWSVTRDGNRAGPFIAPHLPSIGITLTSLGSGFPREDGSNVIVFRYKPQLPLRDFESFGFFWVVSEPARATLLEFAADAIDTVPADVSVRKHGKDVSAGPRWLCDVTLFADVVDESASSIKWAAGVPQYGANSTYAFKRDTPEDLHLFRLWKAPNTIMCSPALANSIRSRDLTGLALVPHGEGAR